MGSMVLPGAANLKTSLGASRPASSGVPPRRAKITEDDRMLRCSALAVLLALASCAGPTTRLCGDARPRAAQADPAARPRPAPPTAVPPELAAQVRLAEVSWELERPVAAAFAPGVADRIYVAEQAGMIRVLELGGEATAPRATSVRPWADLRDRARYGDNEQGLLGLAFHPTAPRLYVHYTDRAGDSHVEELPLVDGRPDTSRPRPILRVAQPASNHNGGHLAFGPDGKLWIGYGDGGRAGDPWGNAQACGTRLGKMLRVDVDAATPVVEIVASGLRNPWRYAFDRATGDLYIADVGQDHWEWVHVAPADDLVGHNFGWNAVEGFACFAGACDRTGLTPPVVDYSHDEGCSITGGFVYRGAALPGLTGHYLFADYCSGLLRSIRWERGRVTAHWDWRPVLDPDSRLARLVSFAEDPDGELYLISLLGGLYRLVPAATP
jgi:glucose/arabinose dehydrogenase